MNKKHLCIPVFSKEQFRGLFIQAAWNFENFQGIGFAYALVPLLRHARFTEEEVRDLIKRHLTCFNTNPYFAGMILGGTLRLEEERAQGRVTAGEIDTFKNDLTGALGALGDSLTWGALRPLAGLAAALAAVIDETAAPLLFLVLYNLVTLWIRGAGLWNGYAYGSGLLTYLNNVKFQKKIYWMNGMILFAVGLFLPLWILQAVPAVNFTYFGLFVFMALLVWAGVKAERKGVPLLIQAAALLILSQGLSHMGWWI